MLLLLLLWLLLLFLLLSLLSYASLVLWVCRPLPSLCARSRWCLLPLTPCMPQLLCPWSGEDVLALVHRL